MALYRYLKPLLFALDPEFSHNLVKQIGRAGARISPVRNHLRTTYDVTSPALETQLFGKTFRNPVGLAAGFDKNGELLDLFAALGFGFVEIGSVSLLPASGNPRPRLFRLPADRALINRMGLNNVGAAEVAKNIQRARWTRESHRPPLGVNIVKTNDPTILGDNAVRDIVECYEKVVLFADYIVLNVSCPNTEDGKTFEVPEALEQLLRAVSAKRETLALQVPTLVKFSPDIPLGELETGITIAERYKIDGYVLANTTSSRDNLQTPSTTLSQIGRGGLSGKPLRGRALERIRFVYRLLKGRKPIIGVGGIANAESAYEFIRAGASIVECYTALVYGGPGVAKEINEGLLQLMARDGLKNIAEARGRG